jgi:hypothetical protein
VEPVRKTVTLRAVTRANFPQRSLCAVALIFGALLCGCEDRSKTARDAAEDLARHFAEQRFAEAYQQAASAFRFTRSGSYFEARVRDLGLCDAREVKWGEPERHGRLATIRGVFKFKDGSMLPLNFDFSMEDGGWRLIEARSDPAPGTGKVEDVFAVASRTKDTIGARAMEILEPNAVEIPAEPQLRQLAEDTLLLFNEAIQNGGDFSPLYAAASDRWKFRGRDPRELAYGGSDPSRLAKLDPYNNENRLTAAALRNAFAAAIEAKVDLSPIKGKKIILSEPARVNSDGVLNVNGTFDSPVYQANMPGQNRKVEFGLEYVREAAQWKLFGLTVRIIAADTAPAK